MKHLHHYVFHIYTTHAFAMKENTILENIELL